MTKLILAIKFVIKPLKQIKNHQKNEQSPVISSQTT